MRNKHWSDIDKKYLEKNYHILTMGELCKKLQRTQHSVRWMAALLELTDKPNYWRREELMYLAENYTLLSAEEIATNLKRTPKSITAKIHDLRISQTLEPIVDTSSIEQKVPFYKGKAGEYRMLLQAMKQGDSFEYPADERQTLQNQVKYFSDRLYRTREVDIDVRRIWRLL